MKRDAPSAIQGTQAGLTLIEMIIALAVGMLVVVFLAQGTGLIRRFSAVQGTIAAQDETLIVRDHLRRQIESGTRSQPSRRSGFAGVGDTAVFTAPGDRLLEAGGPIRVTLAAVLEGHRMTLAETRAAAQQKGRTTRLITGAERIAFAYAAAPVGNGADAWVSEWTDPEAGPVLMRIDVTFPAGDRRRWPPFVVFLPSGGAANTQTAATAPSPTLLPRAP